jgi:hypothetical protein
MTNKFKNQDNPTIYGMSVAFYNEWKKKPYTLSFKQIETLAYICKEIGYPVRDKKCGVCLKNSCELVEKYIKEYIANEAEQNVISTEDTYTDKTVLLLGNNPISKKMQAQRKKYDIIVGINEIWKSPNYKYVDLHYIDVIDYEFINNYEEIVNYNQYVIFKRYDPQIKHILKYDRVYCIKDETELSNIWVIENILKSQPAKLEVIGLELDEDILNYLITNNEEFTYNA